MDELFFKRHVHRKPSRNVGTGESVRVKPGLNRDAES